MQESTFVRGLARIYAVMLYAYPREFRLEYGGEMTQVFRDRCGYLARTSGVARAFQFAMFSGMDWFKTTLNERFAAARTSISHARKPAARGFVAEWAMTILMYLFATTTLVQAYVVPTGSMEGTIRVGDHVLVDRLAYSDPGAFGRHLLPYRDIRRGDIVVFHYPENTKQDFVKRVIGLPGDRIHLAGKQVYRNGRRLIEPYTQHIAPEVEPYRDDFPVKPEVFTTPRGEDMFHHHVFNGEVVVPPGTLFVMGDNRDNSADSRYWGFVPRDYVVGKPLFIYWSYDAPTEDLTEWSLSHVVDVTEHFFTKTRWNRIFQVPRYQAAQEAEAEQ
ncbi:MAG TPA: signal peptidase I [Bryobacteraceae bacterium]|nr:signal peptidase I [Bryobacteraceae bacterium]